MLRMHDFQVTAPSRRDALLGYAGENRARRFAIEVDEPGAWAYKLELRAGDGAANILDLTREGNVLSVELERGALQFSGFADGQIRAIDGDRVKYSNIFPLYIAESLQAETYFAALAPSEFAQLEARLTALKTGAEGAAETASESAARAETARQTAAAHEEAAGTARTGAAQAAMDAEYWARRAGQSAAPQKRTLTLPAGGWREGAQTVALPGIAADEGAQLIQLVPALASQTAYLDAGVLCTGQGENSLFFTCKTLPAVDLIVFAVVQEVAG